MFPFVTFRLLVPLALAAAVAAPGAARAGGGPRTLSVAAAANLKPALDTLSRAFEEAHPGVRVAVTTGASGTFVAQLRAGAPFDVFLSADRDYPRKCVEAGLATADGEVVYALGTLVAWTPPGSRLDLRGRGLAALADASVREVAMANPAVAPYGRLAEGALRAAGVLDAVRPRLVLGESVGQAAQFAAAGVVDAALLPRSLALAPALRAGSAWPVPPGLAPPIAQSLVILRAAREPDLARAFVAFLRGPRGRELLARAGYDLPR